MSNFSHTLAAALAAAAALSSSSSSLSDQYPVSSSSSAVNYALSATTAKDSNINSNVTDPFLQGNISTGASLHPGQQHAGLSMTTQVFYSTGLVISIMGLIGNLLTVLVLRCHKPKTVYIFFLQILAVADGLVMFFTIGMVTTGYTCDHAKVSCQYVMKFVVSGHDVSQFLSHWVLVTASLDRYLAIDNPFKKGCTRSKGCTMVIIAVTIVVGLLLAVSHWVYIAKDHKIYVTALNTVLRYLVPLLILAVVNIRLIFYVRRAQKDHSKLTRKDSDHNSTRSATIILIIVVLVFLFCGLTRGIFLVLSMSRYRFPGNSGSVASLVTWILMLINNAVNFLIYVMFYQKFRQNLKKIFRVCRKKKLGQNTQSTILHSKYHTVQSMTSRLSLTNQSAL